MTEQVLQAVSWNADGLVPVIAVDAADGEVLMMAWMNHEALAATLAEGYAVYWSRSRGRLWRKGETSGHQQRIHELRLDCDADTLLIKVEQIGGIACHTGRRSCFFRRLEDGAWLPVEAVLRNPADMYPNAGTASRGGEV